MSALDINLDVYSQYNLVEFHHAFHSRQFDLALAHTLVQCPSELTHFLLVRSHQLCFELVESC